MSETIKECEQRIGRKLTKKERAFKALLNTECACGHDGNAHCAPLLGGPVGHPCWANDCPCYSFPGGETLAEKDAAKSAAALSLSEEGEP